MAHSFEEENSQRNIFVHMEPLAYFKAKEIKNLSHMLEFSIGVNAWLELWSFPLILGQ